MFTTYITLAGKRSWFYTFFRAFIFVFYHVKTIEDVIDTTFHICRIRLSKNYIRAGNSVKQLAALRFIIKRSAYIVLYQFCKFRRFVSIIDANFNTLFILHECTHQHVLAKFFICYTRIDKCNEWFLVAYVRRINDEV
ncbi:Uncharacterised protein [Chlamydia trachomatis]|nr:Uncharacterised protein [Chlamydia trachomatis]